MADIQHIAVAATRNTGGSVLETVYVVSNDRVYRCEVNDGRFKQWQQLPDIPAGHLEWTRPGASISSPTTPE